MPLTRDEDIAELLTEARNIAVVGLSEAPIMAIVLALARSSAMSVSLVSGI